jgi:hypothetical protein
MAFSWNPGLIRSAHALPATAGTKHSSGAPGYGGTLRPDTGRRAGRDRLPPLPHLKLAAEPGEPQQRGDDRPDE